MNHAKNYFEICEALLSYHRDNKCIAIPYSKAREITRKYYKLRTFTDNSINIWYENNSDEEKNRKLSGIINITEKVLIGAVLDAAHWGILREISGRWDDNYKIVRYSYDLIKYFPGNGFEGSGFNELLSEEDFKKRFLNLEIPNIQARTEKIVELTKQLQADTLNRFIECNTHPYSTNDKYSYIKLRCAQIASFEKFFL